MEVINSFFNNIKDKLTNPFFGTLILVLIIGHWELWYAVFNFDSDCTLTDKLIFIKNYIAANLTFGLFMWDVGKAIIFMFLGYLIIVGTRSLVLWVEFWLMPFVTGKVINKSVVKKSEYDDVVKEREQYFDQYEEQRKNVRNFSKTIDEQTELIKLKDKNLIEQSEEISKSIGELALINKKLQNSQNETLEKNEQINKLRNSSVQLQNNYDTKIKEYNTKLEKLEKYENLFFGSENEAFYSSIRVFPPIIVNTVLELKKEKKWDSFLSLGNFFENGGTMGGEVRDYMIKKGIAFERGKRETFTPLGKVIWHYRKVFDY